MQYEIVAFRLNTVNNCVNGCSEYSSMQFGRVCGVGMELMLCAGLG